MGVTPSADEKRFRLRVSEDWWAVMVGFFLIALVYLQVLVEVPW